MNIVVVGSQGAGKGSLAKLIARDFKIVHVSSGDIFRENMAAKTPLGLQIQELVNHGVLVPDETVVDIMKNRLDEADCSNGFVLDGFPRTMVQAQKLTEFTKIDIIIKIIVAPETAVIRMCNRYICQDCETIHNTRWDDVTKCKNCGGKLYQREDDREEAILKRLEEYYKQSAPIVDFLAEQKDCKLITITSELADAPEDMYRKFQGEYAKVF